ncbi:hypothetical protein M2401_001097 [Pseudomonas sp. JUb42]|uniref:hypothetical protein n=1 Tax=Pseudomonas sp. JUb42 TaxID=2940611 RepID=UPI002168ED71|nr:hypothetical protein [Pseudomonas sp. JUb42]MCS3467376.1 hypothetical protein [Pseudomonas sp. JUb42]
MDLDRFVMISGSSEKDFHEKVEQVYQEVPDKDVVCAMLLQTVSCLSSQKRSDRQISDFRNYLEGTRSCHAVEKAVVTVDNIVQFMPEDAISYKKAPVVFDLFIRNSGDSPAFITKVRVYFDESTRKESGRLPADMQQVSAVYTIAVDAKGARVTGAQLDTPAMAYYPSPGSKVLIVDSPISQTLPPRSTDRFRIKISFLEDAELRGPLKEVRADVEVNGEQAVESKLINLVESRPCMRYYVSGVQKEICK